MYTFTKSQLESLTQDAAAERSVNKRFTTLPSTREFVLVETEGAPRLLFQDSLTPSDYYNIWINGEASYGPKTLDNAASLPKLCSQDEAEQFIRSQLANYRNHK